jgi:hypothetical protein
MTVLTLDRTARGQYALGEVGSLRNLKRFSAEIRAGDAAWTLRRALAGVGQVINASDSAGGARVGRYVPHGFLHLRGVFRGTLTAGETSYDWRAKHQLSSHFAVSSAGVELAHFDAGPQAQPVRVHIEDLTALEPLELLFCCHLVKQMADTAKVGTVAAGAVAVGRS